MTGSSYPLLNAFWTMFLFFGFFLWIWLIIAVFSDIFRSRDLSGWGKALWSVGIIFVPLFGVLLYLIARGGKMHERQVQQAETQEAAFRDYVKQAASNGGASNGGDGRTLAADQLAKLADLREHGVLTEQEFEQQKAKVLAS